MSPMILSPVALSVAKDQVVKVGARRVLHLERVCVLVPEHLLESPSHEVRVLIPCLLGIQRAGITSLRVPGCTGPSISCWNLDPVGEPPTLDVRLQQIVAGSPQCALTTTLTLDD